MKRRLLSVFLIYLILMCIELIVGLLSGYFDFPLMSANNYSSEYGLIIVQIMLYQVVCILNNCKKISQEEIIPLANWFAIILMPISSLYIILILLQATVLSWEQVIIAIILILLMNFSTFYLYDVISAALADKIEKKLLNHQNKYYNKQFEIMEASLKTTKAMKHDLRNHLSVIYALVDKGESEAALKHLSNMTNIYDDKKQYSCTENIDIDSILNFKIQEAEQKNIKTSLNLSIPKKMNISSFDLIIILGNLLDNAIEAVSELEKERQIKIIMNYRKGSFIIKVENPYQGERLKEGNRYITMHKEKSEHGLGLKNIKKVLRKYDGVFEIKDTENIFSVRLLMFI
jgi:sensor histidine kinase YesM